MHVLVPEELLSGMLSLGVQCSWDICSLVVLVREFGSISSLSSCNICFSALKLVGETVRGFPAELMSRGRGEELPQSKRGVSPSIDCLGDGLLGDLLKAFRSLDRLADVSDKLSWLILGNASFVGIEGDIFFFCFGEFNSSVAMTGRNVDAVIISVFCEDERNEVTVGNVIVTDVTVMFVRVT